MIVVLLSQLLSYSAGAWIAFVIITLFLSAIFGANGLVVGHCIVAAIVLVLDIRWVQSEMASPTYDPNTGPDFDGVFFIVFPIGLLIRIILINSVLLPMGLLGIWWTHRRPNDFVTR